MSGTIVWIAAEAERPAVAQEILVSRRRRQEEVPVEDLPVHGFPGKAAETGGNEVRERESQDPNAFDELRAGPSTSLRAGSVSVRSEETRAGHPGEENPSEEAPWDFEAEERERELRVYRGRTVTMLRRYMRYSMETGRMPSILGREFFRAKVTAYTVVTFEDRVIFVHDMERCIDKLDEFSRQLLARHVLQEHDLPATARLLHCNEKTVRRLMPMALDVLSEILLEVGLLARLDSRRQNSCQGGVEGESSVSRCEDTENKF
jgi:hypothetical protein